MRFRYVVNEVLVGLWRNATMTVAMIITMSVSLTMLGASMLMYAQVNEMKEYYYDKVEVSIFLRKDVTDGQRRSLDAALVSSPLVKNRIYESKQQAAARFREEWRDSPDLVAAVGADSLPESFRVKLKDPERYQEFVAQIKNRGGIHTIVDQRRLLDKIFSIFTSLQRLALVIAVVMAAAAVLLVGNTMQVAAYSKRREVAVMKLVGASNWFIQAPFVLEAMVAGIIGALVGFALLFIGRTVILQGSMRALTGVLPSLPGSTMWMMLPLMAAVGAGVSGLTAWTTLRFHLRV
jgi:cell division transport system permease protein